MSERKPIGLSIPHRKVTVSGMKCVVCGAATDVKESRTRENNMVYRKRVCFNDHKFTTKEIPVPQELIDEEIRAARIANLKGKK